MTPADWKDLRCFNDCIYVILFVMDYYNMNDMDYS